VIAPPPHRRWALAAGWFNTWRAFHQSWKSLPGGAFKRWCVTLVLGFALCGAFVSVLTVIAKQNADALTRRDTELLLRVSHGPISFADAILLESFGNLAYMVPLTLAAAVVAARNGRPLLALSFPAAYVLQRPLVLLGWWIWNRQRPRLIAGGIAAPGLHSFPSGHVALMLAVYGLLAWLWVRASRSAVERLLALVLLAALLLVTGLARVRLGSHWPSDVAAGYVGGAAWLLAVITAIRRGERGVR
jgi:membrane-associated phospholipid phosphatase